MALEIIRPEDEDVLVRPEDEVVIEPEPDGDDDDDGDDVAAKMRRQHGDKQRAGTENKTA